MKKQCKNCKNWKSEQAELDYSPFKGICTCHKWKFSTSEDGDIMLLDRKNLSNKHANVQRYENQSDIIPVGAVESSRYCFVTNEYFGCIHFKPKKS